MRGRKPVKYYLAFSDYETTTRDSWQSIEEEKEKILNDELYKTRTEQTRVYCYCISCKELDFLSQNREYNAIEYFFKDIEELNNRMLQLDKEDKENKHEIIMYFHNMSNFDGRFILNYILKNNIEYEICQDRTTIYEIKLGKVKIRDSRKILNIPLVTIGKTYCKKHRKTHIDSNDDYLRPYDYICNEDELKYCLEDVLCLEEGMTTFFDLTRDILLKNGCPESAKTLIKKMTIPSIAFSCFAEMSGFEELCKGKMTYADDAFCRNAYVGGYVFSNDRTNEIPRNENTKLRNTAKGSIKMIDCNSMYPTQYAYKPLPYGKPVYYHLSDLMLYYEYLTRNDALETYREFSKSHKCFVINGKISYLKLKEGYPAIFPKKCIEKLDSANFDDNSYIREYIGDEYNEIQFTITNIDFDRILEYYDIEFEISTIMSFKCQANFYKKYADLWISIKKQNKGAVRAIAKLFLNSPYGKLAQSPLRDDYVFELGQDGELITTFVETEVSPSSSTYLAQAIFITAYARQDLWDACECVGWAYVIYTDTDSVKFIDFNDYSEKALDIYGILDKEETGELGLWKVEGRPVLFKTIAPKKYIFYEDGKVNFTCGGMNKHKLAEILAKANGIYDKDLFEDTPENEFDCRTNESIKCTYDEALKVFEGFDTHFKLCMLQAHQVCGGVVLETTIKEINESNNQNHIER